MAIIITIMVLELKIPHMADLQAIVDLLPSLLTYVLSFVFIGIYWNNHHHMLSTVHHVNGGILWANMHLLFWLSLVPFATGWMGENRFETFPTAFYGVILLMSGIAYYLLQTLIVRSQGSSSILAKAIGKDWKGKLAPLAYLLGIGLSFINPQAALTIYVLEALIWLIPDTRIERINQRSAL